MVIKVDYELAMTVLAWNLLRLLALDQPPSCQRLASRSCLRRLAKHVHLCLDQVSILIMKIDHRAIPLAMYCTICAKESP